MPYKDVEKAREANRKSYRRHHAQRLNAHKRWRETNPSYLATYQYRTRYGLSRQDVARMMDEQGHVCALCGGPFAESGKFLPVVDHCHATGKARGILHRTCNSGIGMFSDAPELLRKAADYLERTK